VHADSGSEDVWPAEQAVHVLAPAEDNVLVIEPAAHDSQTEDETEYCPLEQATHATVGLEDVWPSGQAVHELAPGEDKVLVVEPDEHVTHATVGLEDVWPAGQAVHVFAPAEVSVLVVEPAAQPPWAAHRVRGVPCSQSLPGQSYVPWYSA
jgi:hypothetical protein